MTVTVRLFAAAAEAAGTDDVALDGPTVADLTRALDERYGDTFARIRVQCSVMVDGVLANADHVLAEGSIVDVLPPFAGG
jgi:molybdopterin converting factor small subunit